MQKFLVFVFLLSLLHRSSAPHIHAITATGVTQAAACTTAAVAETPEVDSDFGPGVLYPVRICVVYEAVSASVIAACTPTAKESKFELDVKVGAGTAMTIDKMMKVTAADLCVTIPACDIAAKFAKTAFTGTIKVKAKVTVNSAIGAGKVFAKVSGGVFMPTAAGELTPVAATNHLIYTTLCQLDSCMVAAKVPADVTAETAVYLTKDGTNAPKCEGTKISHDVIMLSSFTCKMMADTVCKTTYTVTGTALAVRASAIAASSSTIVLLGVGAIFSVALLF